MSHAATLLAFAVVAVVAAAPHIGRTGAASPLARACVWAAALTMRALFWLCVSLLMLFVVPSIAAFDTLFGWCVDWHLPLAGHIHVPGSAVGAALSALPALLLLAGATHALVELRRASRAVRRAVSVGEVGPGPGGSTLIESSRVLLAAAGILRPRILLSTAALSALDSHELAAGLAHERAHISRGHRYVLIAASLCRGASWSLPGGRHAVDQLAFQLERDADEVALARGDDRLALASAICKAALPQAGASPSLSALAGQGQVTRRVNDLLVGGAGEDAGPAGRAMFGLMLLASAAMAAVTVQCMAALAQMPHLVTC
jgi:bla regulator protein blaR1